MTIESLHALAYVSRAARDLDPGHIGAFVAEAAEFNTDVGVTGALVFDGTCFFQYIEGSPSAIEDVFTRICASHSHIILMEIANGPVAARRFEGWSMFYREGFPSGIEGLNWREGNEPADAGFESNLGISALRYFWGNFPEKAEIVDN